MGCERRRPARQEGRDTPVDPGGRGAPSWGMMRPEPVSMRILTRLGLVGALALSLGGCAAVRAQAQIVSADKAVKRADADALTV